MATLPELFARQIGTVDVIGDVLLDNLAEELAAAIKYSADQPRVPAGTPGGGQFAPADGGGIAGAGGTPPQHPTEFVPGVGGQPFIPGLTQPGHEPPTPPSPPSAPTPQTTPTPTPTASGRPPAAPNLANEKPPGQATAAGLPGGTAADEAGFAQLGSPPRSSAPNSPEQASLASTPVTGASELGGGIHKTYVVTLDDGSRAVAKPESSQGKPAMLAEAGAYDIAQEVGMNDIVPVTTIMDAKDCKACPFTGLASEQAFSEGHIVGAKAERLHPDWVNKISESDRSRAKAFDHMVGNSDRHTGNWMVNKDGHLSLIDNGFIFRPYGGYTSVPSPKSQLIPPAIQKAWSDAEPRIVARLTARGIGATEIATVVERIHTFATLSRWAEIR